VSLPDATDSGGVRYSIQCYTSSPFRGEMNLCLSSRATKGLGKAVLLPIQNKHIRIYESIY